MEYQDRVNRPLGMSDVDLLIYDKDIYTMYRTHEGLEPDAFRYDPIVSAGMLASDYAYAEGMQWVNLLTPDSQDKINPGDDLVVPVRTYDYYGENLPIEKKLTHEVSYTSNQLNTVRAMGLHNNFVGDFNNYFDQESGLLGENLLGPVPSPIPIGGGGTGLPPRNYAGPRVAVGPKTVLSPTVAFALENTPKYRCKITPPYYFRDDVNGTILDYTKCPRNTTAGANVGIGNVGGSGTTETTTTTTTTGGTSGGTSGGGEVIDGGAFPMSGGGGGGSASGGGEEAPGPAPTETKDTTSTEKEIKADYKFIIIGIIVLGAIGYYYAKTYNKDIKTFSVSGAIVGGILGYMYNQHQTKPIDLFTKLGIKGKSESGYFIDDI
jgi:hypothetical protein